MAPGELTAVAVVGLVALVLQLRHQKWKMERVATARLEEAKAKGARLAESEVKRLDAKLDELERWRSRTDVRGLR